MNGTAGYLAGFDPIETAPALIAVVVGLLVWRRHTADRRARLFLALAASELAFGLPLLLMLYVPQTPVAVAAIDGALVTLGLLSAALFLHFGLAFPHARPWLRRGHMSSVYTAAVIMGIVPIGAALAGIGAQAQLQDVFDSVLILVGPLVLIASVTACIAIYRSYREMTADERRRYRLPVLGVLVGMIAGLVMDVVLTTFVTVFAEAGVMMWTANTVELAVMVAELVLPLFFFMAAVRYRLLEHHAQDYVTN